MSDTFASDEVFPDTLMIRDTKIIPEDGGGRIYTTVGFGYHKVKYVRGDLYERLRGRIATALIELQCDVAPNVEAAIAALSTTGQPTPVQHSETFMDDERTAIVNAYKQGAMDVHQNYQPDRAPDFTEAAHDYASSTAGKSPPK